MSALRACIILYFMKYRFLCSSQDMIESDLYSGS